MKRIPLRIIKQHKELHSTWVKLLKQGYQDQWPYLDGSKVVFRSINK